MRAILAYPLVAFVAAVQLGAAQQPFLGEIYRGPLIAQVPASFVEPPNRAPLSFSNGTLIPEHRGYTLRTRIGSQSVRSIPVEGITLRAAFGPTMHGMVTFRLRPGEAAAPGRPLVIPPSMRPPHLSTFIDFSAVLEDRPPGRLALKPSSKVVFTLQQVDSEDGSPIFENPGATELLWEALGRPAPPSH